MNYIALEKLEEFVFECLLQYSEQGILNDPSYEWNICHHPEPKCLGGEETKDLLREHHAIHGVLQSEAYQRPCIWGWEGQYLTETEDIELFEK